MINTNTRKDNNQVNGVIVILTDVTQSIKSGADVSGLYN